MRKGRKSGFTLVELLVVIVIIGILAALLMPAISKAIRSSKLMACGHNLKQLWDVQNIYLSQFGGRAKMYPAETGGQFWMKLTQTTPPLIDPQTVEIFDCPISPIGPQLGTCQYRGPSSNINEFADSDPVGADDISAHGPGEGGNVIRKSGDVMNYTEVEPVWITANTKLTK